MTATLVDGGIDFIRVTSQQKFAQSRMYQYWWKIAQGDAAEGFPIKDGGLLGFYGKRSRHTVWGKKQDWEMVQVSGRRAKRALEMAYAGSQATRIDLQLTWRLEKGTVGAALEAAYRSACAHVRPKGRPLAVTKIENRLETETVYVGRRTSDLFVRCYDKFKESGEEDFRDCIRMEVEIKGRAAKALWQMIADKQITQAGLLSMLLSVLKDRGIEPPTEDFDEHDIIIPKPLQSTPERTLAWLATQVAPSVQRLVATHGWKYPFLTLFNLACTEFDKTAIMNAMSISWGS